MLQVVIMELALPFRDWSNGGREFVVSYISFIGCFDVRSTKTLWQLIGDFCIFGG